MAVAGNARKKWEKVRGFALGLPGAAEEFPWGETVAKVDSKVFVFLGVSDGSHQIGVTVKPKDAEAHAHALTSPGAEPGGGGPAVRPGRGELSRERAKTSDGGAPCPVTGPIIG